VAAATSQAPGIAEHVTQLAPLRQSLIGVILLPIALPWLSLSSLQEGIRKKSCSRDESR